MPRVTQPPRTKARLLLAIETASRNSPSGPPEGRGSHFLGTRGLPALQAFVPDGDPWCAGQTGGGYHAPGRTRGSWGEESSLGQTDSAILPGVSLYGCRDCLCHCLSCPRLTQTGSSLRTHKKEPNGHKFGFQLGHITVSLNLVSPAINDGD